MTMVPDVTTGYLDPFYSEKTIAFYCNIVDPVSYESYVKDPRFIAKKLKNISNLQVWVIQLILVLRQNSLFLMT